MSTPEEIKKRERRQLLVNEIAQTEISYVSQLLLAKQLFLHPAMKRIGTDQQVLTAEEASIMFGNLDQLLNEDKELCQQLQIRVKNWTHESCVGDLFLHSFNSVSSNSNYNSTGFLISNRFILL